MHRLFVPYCFLAANMPLPAQSHAMLALMRFLACFNTFYGTVCGKNYGFNADASSNTNSGKGWREVDDWRFVNLHLFFFDRTSFINWYQNVNLIFIYVCHNCR